MSETIRNLWPATKLDVLSPIAILKQQASYLRKVTQGILEAEVSVQPNPDRWLRTSFTIVAPALDRYRLELFMIAHSTSAPYPVTVYSEGLITAVHEMGLLRLLIDNDPDNYNPEESNVEVVAASQDDFVTVLELVLASPRTMGILHSLFARTNDLASHESDHSTVQQ